MYNQTIPPALKVIHQAIERNNGIITTEEANKQGINNGTLSYWSRKGELEQPARGLYIVPDKWVYDELYLLNHKYRKGVFSLLTSLNLHNYTDVIPDMFYMTFPRGYNTKTLKDERNFLNYFHVDEKIFSIGIETISSKYNNPVKAYNIERTLCDILLPKYKLDISIVTTAFKQYTKSKNRNIPRLMRYAKQIGVSEKLHTYMEVLS